MPCVDASADNSGVLKRLLVQEFPECGDVKANETTPALSDDAVLEETAFILACIVPGNAQAFGYLRDPAGARIEQKTEGENREFYSRF